jgi:hypothetical protein
MLAALRVQIALGPPGEYVIKVRPDYDAQWKGIALFSIDLETQESVPRGWKLDPLTGLYKL